MVAPRKAPMDRLKPAAAAAPPEPSSFVEIVSGGVERTEETLFAIDGVRFNITVPVQAGLTLQAIDKMTEVGESGAMMWLLRQLIGAHAYTALSTHPDVTAEHLVVILARLQEITMGELEDAQGKG